jgi:hypothetical protein
VAVVAVVAFANAVTWSLITPPFDAPDETDHFAYSQYLAETGKAASQKEGERPAWSGEETVALDGVRLVSYIEQADARAPWTALDERRWAEREARLMRSLRRGRVAAALLRVRRLRVAKRRVP